MYFLYSSVCDISDLKGQLIYLSFELSGQAIKMFDCENPGGQKFNQLGRESIFLLIFRLCIQTKFSKELKR